MRIPNHVGVIPDGNRRWAGGAGLDRSEGYLHGLEPGLELLRAAREYGVRELTYYGFTTDNCHRPAAQIAAFTQACVEAVELIATEPVSLLVVGNTENRFFPQALLPYTTRTDKNGGGMRVNFLVNYGWEWDLSDLCGNRGSRKGITDRLQSSGVSRMDLIIRWGGMRRLSGFLPVQSVYADFYVVDSLWPDFDAADFQAAMNWYNRQDVTLGG